MVSGYTDTKIYWLGLDNIHYLTKDYDYTLIIEFWDIDQRYFTVKYGGFRVSDDYSISYIDFMQTSGDEISNIFLSSGSSLGECTDGKSYWWGSCDTSNNFFNQDFPQWDNLLLKKIKLTLQRLLAKRLISEKKNALSSTVLTTDYEPNKAFDGILGHVKCFISEQEIKPWLQVDLSNLYHINNVKIYNRDYRPGRLKMVTISVSNNVDMVNDKRTCTAFDKMIDLIETHYCIDNLEGRYVRISIGPFSTINNHYLQVAEMQVYGWQ